MSNGCREHICVCGSRMSEVWDNDSLTLDCDNGCTTPYPQDEWEAVQKLIENGIACEYKGETYYKCGDLYFYEVAENNSKIIYDSFSDEKSVKKWIDESSIPLIL